MCQRHVSNYAANTKHPEAQVDVQLAELDAFGLKCPFFFWKECRSMFSLL